jgi:hypothetical protein
LWINESAQEDEMTMSVRAKTILLAGVILAGVAAVLWLRDDVKPVGTISRQDVLQIRRVVSRAEAPGWKSFTEGKLRFWPSLLLERATFRIVDMREDSIRTVAIHSDGAREEQPHVIIRFQAFGRPARTRVVAKQQGQWAIRPTLIIVPDRIPRSGF